jgi:hypothetical protein
MMTVERIRNLRFLPLDTYPRLIDLAQRPVGKVILLALFALLMVPLHPVTSWPITLRPERARSLVHIELGSEPWQQ